MAPIPVEPAFLEFQQPSIAAAWSALLDRKVRQVDVAPLLLFAAGHARQDIPDAIAACCAVAPRVGVAQSRPISRHPGIVELVCKRLAETLCELGTAADRTAVVMVGRGSHDPCAQADMRLLSEIVARRIGVAATVTAFYAMAEPRLPDVLERVAGSGRYDAIVVHPHLLFAGRLYEAIVAQTERAAGRFTSRRFRTGPYLGPDPLVAAALVDRIAEACNAPLPAG